MTKPVNSNTANTDAYRTTETNSDTVLNNQTVKNTNENNGQIPVTQYTSQNGTFNFEGQMRRFALNQSWANKTAVNNPPVTDDGYIPKTITFSPQEVGAFAKKGKLPQTVQIDESYFEQKLFNSYGLDQFNPKDRAILQNILQRENPGDAIDWKTNGKPTDKFTAVLNAQGNYEVNFDLGKTTDKQLNQAAFNRIFFPDQPLDPNLLKLLSNNTSAGNFKQTAETPDLTEMALDLTQMGLDVVGIFEPTPFADLTNTGISAVRGNWGDAALSVIGVIPYIGDVAKLAKIPKWIKAFEKISSAIDKFKQIAVNGGKGAEAVKEFVKKAKSVIDNLPIEKLPDSLRDAVKSVKKKIDDFVAGMKKTDNPADDLVKKSEKLDDVPKVDNPKPTKTDSVTPTKQPDIEPPNKTNKPEKQNDIDEVKNKKEVEEAQKQKEIEEAKLKKQKEIDDKYENISKNGHAVQRHGEEITEVQLDDRAMYGKDPMTGTTDDGIRKDASGNPLPHRSGKDATKFTNKESLVKAEDYVRNSQNYKDALEEAVLDGSDQFAVSGTKLEDIFGVDYKNQVFGKTRTGTKNNPTGSVETDFTDGTVKAVFKKDSSGKWQLETMYPEPKN